MKILSFCAMIVFLLSSLNFCLNKQPLSYQKLSKKITQTDKVLDSLTLWATYYYIPTIEYKENGIDFLDKNKKPLGIKVDSCDWCKACIEGTVKVRKDGKIITLNYETRSDSLQYDCRKCEKYKDYTGYEKTGQVLWSKTDRGAKGVQEYRLVPFKSIAVDSAVIPYGSTLFIPQAKGIEYTGTDKSKKIHDGYFFAADAGSKIKGNHIDIFIGTATESPFSFIKSDSLGTFKAYFISDSVAQEKLLQIHK
ncbi:3D domain-containing protein [Bernardetia sp. ABR2-2B]|uniref:3D domain-containing protein n=1 Tax=Bernardetia sp. ABR2-2B TaxID=3127472 RepID=UPI0030D01F54